MELLLLKDATYGLALPVSFVGDRLKTVKCYATTLPKELAEVDKGDL